MKKLSLLLAIIMLLSFAACGEDTSSDASSQDLGAYMLPVEYPETRQFVSSGEQNGFYYIVYDDHVELVDYAIPEGQTSVEFPTVIEGKPVTAINITTLQNNAYIKSAKIPETVTEIGNYLFCNCTSLTELTLPSKVEKIGCAAFYGTPWFETLTDEFVTVGEGVLIKYNGDGGDVVIPDNVKYISDALAENSRILSITVPVSVEGISDYAFYNCSSTSDITIPSHISDIGSHAFDETTWLMAESGEFITVGNNVLIEYTGSATDVTVPDGIKYIAGAFGGNETITSVVIPSSVVRVRSGGFYDCTALTSVEFLGNDTFIEQAAFADCSKLTSVKLPKNLKVISSQMFYSCSKLESVTLPQSIQYIGSAAFYNCSVLKDITLPDTLKEIGSAAFFGCVALPSINLPESIVKLGEVSFACCYELNEFTLPSKVTEIPTGLWSYCLKIERIYLGEQITSVGEGAFEACSDIEVYVAGETTTFHSDAFLNCDGSYKIYCKKGSEAERFAKENKIKYAQYKE